MAEELDREIKVCYLRELKKYSREELGEIFVLSGDKLTYTIKNLKAYGVLKTASSNDEEEPEEQNEDEQLGNDGAQNKNYYQFRFVGIIVLGDMVLKIYPKYLKLWDGKIKEEDKIKIEEDKEDKEKEMKTVVEVLKKFGKTWDNPQNLLQDAEGEKENLISIMLYMVQDYYDYGVYNNTKEIIESNGNGEIMWDKTINETFTLISHNRPYYIDLKTRKQKNDEYDYFRRLHECVLTEVSQKLHEVGLIDIPIYLSDEDISDFGDDDYIIYRLERELNTVFNTRKQLVLKLILAYIDNRTALFDDENTIAFGTSAFHVVWEKICAEIFDNKLDETLQEIEGEGLLPSINLDDTFKGRKKSKLIDLIDYPQWGEKTASGTLIPDIISIKKLDGSKTEDGKYNYQFVILDAKYYTPIFYKENGIAKIKGQPGVESVTKQYLYQKAYEQFLVDHGFSIKEDVKNCLIFPMVIGDKSDGEGWITCSKKGNEVIVYKNKYAPNVTMEQLFSGDEFVPVQVRFLSADWVYKMYLNGETVDNVVEALEL